MRNKIVSGVCRRDFRLGRIALLAAMATAGSIHAQTSEGDLPEIYGPIGTTENAAAIQPGEETAQIAADCYSTFAGPTQFTWTGTTNQVTGEYLTATAGPTVSGCTFAATSDASWLRVVSFAGSAAVTYQVDPNFGVAPRQAHLSINVDGGASPVT